MPKGVYPHNKRAVKSPCVLCGNPVKGTHHEKYCSRKCEFEARRGIPVGLGRKLSDEIKKKLSLAKLGKPSPTKGIKRPQCSGEKHWRWKGDVPRNKHNGGLYKEWRTKVFERDDYTCQECGIRGGYLYAHHIEPWAKNKDLRFELSNGVTLCKQCHIKIDPIFAQFFRKGVV